MENNEPLQSEKLYLTSREAAQKLGVAKTTMDKWRAAGIGPNYIRVGDKLVGYRESDLIDYLNDNVVDVS